MLLFTIITYASLYIALAFCALCLATGLYYLSELAEEYSVTTKKVLRYSLWVVIGLHVLLLVEGFPFFYVFVGIASHLWYMTMLKNFPSIQLKSKEFIGSCSLFVLSHVIWYWHFVDYRTPQYDFSQLLGFFFALVWFVPAGFFVTLNGSDLSLPSDLASTIGTADVAKDQPGAANGGIFAKRRIAFSFANLVALAKNYLPTRRSQRHSSEGLLGATTQAQQQSQQPQQQQNMYGSAMFSGSYGQVASEQSYPAATSQVPQYGVSVQQDIAAAVPQTYMQRGHGYGDVSIRPTSIQRFLLHLLPSSCCSYAMGAREIDSCVQQPLLLFCFLRFMNAHQTIPWESHITAIVLSLCAGISTGIGGLIVTLFGAPSDRNVGRMLSFAAGVMLFVSFTHLLPESIHVIGIYKAIASFFAGAVFFFIIVKLVPEPDASKLVVQQDDKNDDDGDSKTDAVAVTRAKNLLTTGIVVTLGLAMHNIPEGISTYLSSLKDWKLGAPIAIAIGLHNIPEGIASAVALYAATQNKWTAVKWTFLSGLCEPLGALAFGLFFSSILTNTIVFAMLGATAGIMTMICLQELIPKAFEFCESVLEVIAGNLCGMTVIYICSSMLEAFE